MMRKRHAKVFVLSLCAALFASQMSTAFAFAQGGTKNSAADPSDGIVLTASSSNAVAGENADFAVMTPSNSLLKQAEKVFLTVVFDEPVLNLENANCYLQKTDVSTFKTTQYKFTDYGTNEDGKDYVVFEAEPGNYSYAVSYRLYGYEWGVSSIGSINEEMTREISLVKTPSGTVRFDVTLDPAA